MRDCDFQHRLFDYSRRCRKRGGDAPYDLSSRTTALVPLLRQPTGTGSRAVASSSPVLGSSPLRAVGSPETSRTAMWLFSRLAFRDGATVLEPMESKRQSAIATAMKLPNATAVRMAAFSQRSATKDEVTRPTSTSCFNWGSLASAMCGRTPSVASGDSRSDSSPRAARNWASSMSLFRNWASNPNTAPALAAGQRTTASLTGTKPRLCRAAGTP